MGDDIVKRMREYACRQWAERVGALLLVEAAGEIVRLRAAGERLAVADDEKCDNCRFSADPIEKHYGTVLCRRYPPQLIDGVGTLWPTVDIGDWCGGWEARRG